jgi:hypothetical protein
MSQNYRFKAVRVKPDYYKPAIEVDVVVSINWPALVAELAQKASQNKSRTARAQHGTIAVKLPKV